MDLTRLFSSIPLWLLFFLTIAMLLAATELGSWISRRWVRDREHDGPVGSLVAAVLGLLAFILAFTFGMTTSRFDQRRQLVIDEANAISSAYLSATLNNGPPYLQIRKLLREYLELRLGVSKENVFPRMARSNELFKEMWGQVEVLMQDKKDSDLRTTLVANLSALANIQRSRVTVAVQYRIPGSMWLSLYILAIISMLAIGYQVGTTGSKRLWGMPALALAFALVFSMIADVDRPTEGRFVVSDQPMVDVHNLLNSIP